MKKVLIISYYWPPSGGAGVQRWLKFVKYLGSHGWEPILYVPENPHYPVLDETLLKDVPAGLRMIKNKIWEPYGIYKRFLGLRKSQQIQHGFIEEEKSNTLKKRIGLWIRSNFFIPDARKFWIKPSIKFLKKHFRNADLPDLIISSGPPHSMHLIARGLKNSWHIPWIADFRDPWTGIDFYDQLLLSKRSDRLHRKLEKEVLSDADVCLAVGWHLENELYDLGAKKVQVITNGYDESDFHSNDSNDTKNDKFVLLHLGSLNKDRNSLALWKSLAALCAEDSSFANHLEIRIIGKADHLVFNSLEKYALTKYSKRIEYISHAMVNDALSEAEILLLLLNRTPNIDGIVTGKLFEYLASGKRVLCVGSKSGDAARILDYCRGGRALDFDDSENMKEYIAAAFEEFQKGIKFKSDSGKVKEFSREKLTGQLVSLMNTIIKDI